MCFVNVLFQAFSYTVGVPAVDLLPLLCYNYFVNQSQCIDIHMTCLKNFIILKSSPMSMFSGLYMEDFIQGTIILSKICGSSPILYDAN